MVKKIILGGISTFLTIILLLALFWYLVTRNSPVQTNEEYVGSAACGKCHEKEYASWAKTAHAKAIQDITKEYNPIIGEWNKTLTFQEGDLPEVTIRLEKSDDGLHQVTLVDAADPSRESTFTVARVSGGHGWKQRIYAKIDGEYYPLPLDWNETINDWVPFRLSYWWDSDGEVRKRPLKIMAWGSMCAGCHETGVVTTLGFTGYQKSESKERMIACEKCHGPGAAHTADPKGIDIMRPTDLAFAREVEVCGQCHGYGNSYPIPISRHPMKAFSGEMYRPGKVLAEYSVPGPIRWEGTMFVKKHRQQFFDLQQSAHYENEVGCTGCHTPHGSEFEHNLKAAKDDDKLCLRCHAENPQFQDAAAIARHTGHAAYPDSQKVLTCISCHQQRSTYSAAMGDGVSHHFKIVSPAISLAMFDRFKDAEPLPDYCSDKNIGHASLDLCYSQLLIPNSCGGCHEAWTGSRENLAAGVRAFNDMFYRKEPGTCTDCHSSRTLAFNASVHSSNITRTDEKLPVCTDCHDGHSMGEVAESDFRVSIARKCGACHEKPMESYFNSYHGKASGLGSVETATCSDCHSPHAILSAENPKSTLHEKNIVKTCGTCHERANASFAGFIPHADHHDRETYPTLFFTHRVMTILLVTVFALFGLHAILWLIRGMIERRKQD